MRLKLNPVYLSILLITLFVMLRWAYGGFDISYFIVGGSGYCDPEQTSILLQKGEGYDGKYFYRFALNPFNTENPYGGVFTNTPLYRHQRIFYPVIVWLASVGGQPQLVPLMLVLVNMLASVLFISGIRKLMVAWNLPEWYALVGLLIPGLWMGIARDLAEPVELCLLVFLILAWNIKHKGWFFILATALLFTRETSGIVLFAFALQQLYAYLIKGERNKEIIHWLFLCACPVGIFLLFRYWLAEAYQSAADSSIGGFNFTPVPLKGFFNGITVLFKNNMHKGATGLAAIIFYAVNLVLLVMVLTYALRGVNKQQSPATESWFATIIVLWALTGLFLSHRMWESDWGFARGLSVAFFCSALLLLRNSKIPRIYMGCWIGFMLLMVIRLILKV